MARSGCIYGPSGSRKTTAVKHFAHYIAKLTGKATLLLSTDGGGWAPCDPEVKVGMIRPYRCDVSIQLLSILRKVSQGMWPLATTLDQGTKMGPINFGEYGALAVEGWSSISQAVMRYLPDNNINVGGEERGKLGGFTQQVVVDDKVMTEKFQSNTRGDYGFVQNFIYGFVMNCGSLPFEYVLHTALEAKGEDDDRSTVFGPGIAGKKAISQSPSWVGDLIHAQDYTEKDESVKDSVVLKTNVRMYYMKHPDPATGIPFPAKPRVTPERVGDLMKQWPGGYFEPTPEHGLDLYLEKLDELAAQQAESDPLKAWRKRLDDKLGRGGTGGSEPKK